MLTRRRRGFVTTWTVSGDAAGRTITLPLSGANSSQINCVVNWGDGTHSTVTSATDPNRTHTYASAGTYSVEIRGACEGWSVNNTGDRLKITAVRWWGDRPRFVGFRYLRYGFYGCENLASIPRWPILPSPPTPNSLYASLESLFRGTKIQLLPRQTLSHCRATASVQLMCRDCNYLLTIEPGVFDGLSSLTNVVSAFSSGSHAKYAAIPDGLLRSVPTSVFDSTFRSCSYCSLSPNIFYSPGEQATRFLAFPGANFWVTFRRESWLGSTQGTAPDLWNCDYGETITLSTAPATSWSGGDTITGQTSGATAVVVAKVSDLVYRIKKHFGTFASGEVVGVTGVPEKLAQQNAGYPTFQNQPYSSQCFGGAGNSTASLTNYGDIPANWK